MITGGTGFIASHLVDNLIREKQHEIVLLARSKNKIENVQQNLNEITIDYVDVTDFSALKKRLEKDKPEVIFHLAGQTSHQQSFENPLYDVDVNAKSTLFILQAIKDLKLQTKFVYTSTFIVVGKPDTLPVNEETACRPNTFYGANRLLGEYYCNIYHNTYDIDTCVARITNSFGPREQYKTPSKNALNFLIYKAFKGEDVTIYHKGKFFKDIIFVTDVAAALKTIMYDGKPGNTYWVGSGKETWFYEIAKWFEELTNAKIIFTEPDAYRKKVDLGSFSIDNSKLQSLGWKPTISVRDGINQTLNYFQKINA